MSNKTYLKLFTSLLFTLFILGCTDDDPTEPTEENTLLYSSFEKNGNFSSDGWKLPAQYDSSTDVPAGGGNFSLLLEASQPPEVYAHIKVPVKTEFNEYRLTIASKYSGIEGKMILSLVRNGSVIDSSSVLINNIIWETYSIQDTFSVATGDSFMVQLTAGFSQLLPGKTYFDLCRLYGID